MTRRPSGSFRGAARRRALEYFATQGIKLSGLCSSWAPFVVAAPSVLRPGGRLALVVPAEIGHAVYVRQVVRHLMDRFARVEVVAVREKLFPELAEDCWLLTAAARPGVQRLGFVARIGIGYVTGANDFLHLRPSVARALGAATASTTWRCRQGR